MLFWLCALLITAGLIASRRRKLTLPFPPGPPSLPLVGNILHFPTANFARRLHEIAQQYGGDGLVHFRVLGRSIVVIDSYAVARELLDKKARNYSDRPKSVMSRLIGLDDANLPMMPYGHEWRQHRRLFQQALQYNAIYDRYPPNIRNVTRDLLLSLLEAPKAFSSHIKHSFAASVLSIGYGIEIARDDDYYVNMLDEALRIIEDTVIPGKYLVELFPTLQCLPAWIPGVRFKKDAEHVGKQMQRARQTLFNHGKRLLDSENSGDSIIAAMTRRIASLDGAAAAEAEFKSSGVLIAMYIAGSDTTVASLRAFFLAMAMTPDVQKKAQEELDRVVGRSRLPDFDDRDNLPYTNALVKEVTRWNVVAPLGLPHASIEDDEYNGYIIPKDSVIISNLWALSRDPTIYPDPEAFIPERFLKESKLYSGAQDPYSYIFGFGRRICPGRHLADASLFLACASILHTFVISPPVDDDGRPVKLEAMMDTENIISHPKEFECVIEPRWPGVADLIKA
ncbi:CyP450 monooxygenase [Trametes polyzona]|nr:CyP450 monooxygenase [Trametes polyzona]